MTDVETAELAVRRAWDAAPLRKLLTTRGVAWFDPADVKTVRRVGDDERTALKVPREWLLALRVRIRGDEAWIVCGEPWPDALADVVED